MSKQKNELFVDALANAFVLLLNDNKEFLEMFEEGEHKSNKSKDKFSPETGIIDV